MKRMTIICIIVLMLVVIGLFAFTGNKKETSNTQTQNQIQKTEIKNQVKNEIIENVVENTVANEIENANTIETETFKEEPQTAEQKAIKIVKEDWNGPTAEFSITGMDSNGNYIIQVTDSNTTVLAFYTVDVQSGDFSKREMN